MHDRLAKLEKALRTIIARHEGRNKNYDRAVDPKTGLVPEFREGGMLLAYHSDAVDMVKIARKALRGAALPGEKE